MAAKIQILLRIYSLIICVCVISCTPTAQQQRSYYNDIFQDDRASFRGVNLGDKAEKVLALHPNVTPVFKDILGLRYVYPLSNGSKKMEADYYLDNLQTGKETQRVVAIHARILWGEEVETTYLYEEIQQKLIKKYGFPMGAYGDWIWENDAYEMDISLKMASDRQTIFLSFIRKK